MSKLRLFFFPFVFLKKGQIDSLLNHLGCFFCYTLFFGIFLSRSLQELGTYGCLLVLFVALFFKEKRTQLVKYFDKFFLVVCFLMCWILFSYFYRKTNLRPDIYFSRMSKLWTGFFFPLVGVLGYFFLFQKKIFFFKKLVFVGILGLAINCLIGLIDFLFLKGLLLRFLGFNYHDSRLRSIHHFIALASFLSQMIFVCFFSLIGGNYFSSKNKKHFLFLVLILLFLITFILTWARTLIIWFLFLIFISFFFLKKHKKKILGSFFLLSIVFFIFISTSDKTIFKGRLQKVYFSIVTKDLTKLDPQTLDRVFWIKHGLQMIKEYPLTGVGMCSFIDYMVENYQPMKKFPILDGYFNNFYQLKVELPHNDFIGLWAQIGFIGFFTYYLMLFIVGWTYLKFFQKSQNSYPLGFLLGLMMFLGNGFTDSNFQHAHFSILSIYVIYAFLLRSQKKAID